MTGGGRIGTDSGFATFALHAGSQSGVPRGMLNYIDHTNHMHVQSTGVTSFSLTSPTCVTFSGTATVNGASGYNFTVTHACDNGEPGIHRDTFALTVSGPGLNYSSAGFGDVMTGGNLQLHRV